MTFKISTVLWMVLLVFAFSGLYAVKYKVRSVKAEVTTAEKQLFDEQRNLHVLTAEWAYLNRPERLKALSAKYLDIKPIKGQQIAEFSSIPYAKSDVAKQDTSVSGIKLVSGGSANEDGDALGDE